MLLFVSCICFVGGVMLTVVGVMGIAWGFVVDDSGKRYHWPGFIVLAVAIILMYIHKRIRRHLFPHLRRRI